MKSIRVFLSFVFLVTLSHLSLAQNLTDVLPQDPSVRTGTLANGLKYYIRKNHKPENRAEFRLAVKTGSIMEDDDQQGLAHFCEHMQFNGTEHFPKLDLVNFLESTGVRFGAHLNAYTSFDETVYMLQLPMDKPGILEKGLLVLEDWAGHATFEDVEIDKERGVVIEEWRLGRGANERVENKHLPIELYKSHYADRITIGKKEILEKCSYETLKRFYHDWYRPDLMALIAVGDFDIDKMESEIKSRFGRLTNPKIEKPRIKYNVPLHDTTLVSIAGDKELQFQDIGLIFERPEEHTVTVADYRRDLIGHIYDAMLNARIQEIVQKGNAPFAFAGARDGEFLGGLNAYTSFAIAKPESIEKSLSAMTEEIYRVKQNGFTSTELEREKTTMLNAIDVQLKERDKTESGGYVQEYLRNYLHEEPFPGIEYEAGLYRKFIPTITLAEVNALSAKRMDVGSRVVTVSFQMKDSTTKGPSEASIRKIFESASHGKLAAYEDKTSNKPLLSEKPKPGRILVENTIPELGVTEWKLSNGARVVLKPTDFKNDQILFAASSPGGTSLSSDADVPSADAAAVLVNQGGVADFDATTLKKMLAGKNVSISPTISELQEGFRGSTTPKDAETMFQLLYLYGTQPRKDPAALSAYQAQMTTFLKNRDSDPTTAFRDTIQVTLNQYSQREKPFTLDDVKKVSLDKAYAFYKDRFADFGDFTFYFVGNIDMNQIRGLVETYIASLPTKNRRESWKDIGMTFPKGTIRKSVYKGIEDKSSVSITMTGPFEWNLKNRIEAQAMAEVLSIKLRESLREDKGGVYGVRCSIAPTHFPRQEYQFTIAFGCAPDRVHELIDEAMHKLDTMVMKAPDETYMTKVKTTQLNEDEVNLKENTYWLRALSQYYFNNEDPKAVLERKKLISGLTAEDIHRAAQKYCTKNNLVEVVLYPEKKK